MKLQIVNTWNGGKGGRVVVFTTADLKPAAADLAVTEWFH